MAEVIFGSGLSKPQSSEVFSAQPGRTTLVEHQINTEPEQKVKMCPYWIPEARQVAIEQEIQKMLTLGVIEESCSEWASPVVLVPKPDSINRFCSVFRKLNEILKFDTYSMPRVDELIDWLGKAQYISTLDLTKRILAGSPGSSVKREDHFCNLHGPVPVHCAALLSAWSPNHVQETDGQAAEAPP